MIFTFKNVSFNDREVFCLQKFGPKPAAEEGKTVMWIEVSFKNNTKKTLMSYDEKEFFELETIFEVFGKKRPCEIAEIKKPNPHIITPGGRVVYTFGFTDWMINVLIVLSVIDLIALSITLFIKIRMVFK